MGNKTSSSDANEKPVTKAVAVRKVHLMKTLLMRKNILLLRRLLRGLLKQEPWWCRKHHQVQNEQLNPPRTRSQAQREWWVIHHDWRGLCNPKQSLRIIPLSIRTSLWCYKWMADYLPQRWTLQMSPWISWTSRNSLLDNIRQNYKRTGPGITPGDNWVKDSIEVLFDTYQ